MSKEYLRDILKDPLIRYFLIESKRGRPRKCEISQRDKEIIALRNEGKTLEEIGEIYGISKQRVFQIVGK